MSDRADRHMRDDPGGLLASATKARRAKVKIVIGPAAAQSVAGQHAAWMLVNLLARQHALVSSLEIDCPVTATFDRVALFGEKPTLMESLQELAALLAPANREAAQEVLWVVVVGDGTSSDVAEHTWHVNADGWKWSLGNAPHYFPSVSTVAVGPYLAAAMAAGEIFKRLRGLVRGNYVTDFAGSAWGLEGGSIGDWDRLLQGPDLDQLELGHLVFAGCGAVSQAALATLVASRVAFYAAVVDDEAIDDTNLNRYVLSHDAHIDEAKVAVVQSLLRSHGLEACPIESKWDAFLTDPSNIPTEAPFWLREAQRLCKFEVVLSGVDKNLPRHEIQNALPKILFGGSTDGLTAKAEIYSLGDGTACLKCFNPVENPIALGRDRLNAAMAAGEAAIEALARDVHLTSADLRRMAAATGCGELPPEDLKRFAASVPDMSVGFVSLAAGALQIAQLARWRLADSTQVVGRPKAILAFGTGRIGRYPAAVEAGCQCSPGDRVNWVRIWMAPRLTPCDADSLH
jgi:molybdopterin/thiamine biosynthesis adenylyltransferase